MKIVVTGASGYIGTRFISLAISHNHEVVAASRRPLETISLWFPFDLNATSALTMPEGIEAVIHLAADTTGGSDDGQREVAAARALITAAGDVGAKFVFVSSQTSREDAPTIYGRTKWRIEQEVLAANGLVVRLGQVYGGVERGLFGTLVRLVRQLPMLPAFVPRVLIQPIHVDDCAKGLLRFIERDDIPSGVYCLASPDAVSFTGFLRSIIQYRIHRRKFFVPIPVCSVNLLNKVLGDRLSTKLGLYRLSSLFNLPPMDTSSDLDIIGLELRTLRSGMHRSGNDRRRRLIQEGMALLAYLLKSRPRSALVRRYVRMVEELRGGVPLDLPSWLLRWPINLALLDDRSFAKSMSGKEFGWRIDAATVIAEASIQGAARFLTADESTWLPIALLRMFLALSTELFWRFSRLIIISFTSWVLKREIP